MNSLEYTFCSLREKEVVNIADGKKLGRVIDIGFNCAGKVLGIILPMDKKFFKSMSSSDNIFVPWQHVLKIGNDVILVELGGRSTPESGPPQV